VRKTVRREFFPIHVSRFTVFSSFLPDLDCFNGADIGSFSAIAGIAFVTDYPGLVIPEFENLGA